jgi:hypothetical protein
MKAGPGIASKSKWQAKTTICLQEDLSKGKGIPIGYAIVFFDAFEQDPDKIFNFRIRLAHSPEYMDEDRKGRLEVALRYIMLGVQKIFNVDKEELEKMVNEEEGIERYAAIGKLKH